MPRSNESRPVLASRSGWVLVNKGVSPYLGYKRDPNLETCPHIQTAHCLELGVSFTKTSAAYEFFRRGVISLAGLQ